MQIDTISIALEARTQNYNARLKQAQALSKASFSDIGRSAEKVQKSVNENLAKLGKTATQKMPLSLSAPELSTIAMMAPSITKNDNANTNNRNDEKKTIEDIITLLQREQVLMNGRNSAEQSTNATRLEGLQLSKTEQQNIATLTQQSMQYRQTIDDGVSSLQNSANAMGQLQSISSNVADTFVKGMNNGKTATQALEGAIKSLAQNLLKSGFNFLTSGLQGTSKSGLGGIFSNLFGSLFGFADGGYTGSGGKYQPAGLVHKGEVVWSQNDVRRWGGANQVNAMRQGFIKHGYANGGIVGAPSIPTSPNSTANQTNNNETISVVLQDDSGRMAEIADQRIQTKSGTIVQVAVKQSLSKVQRNINSIAQEGQARYG